MTHQFEPPVLEAVLRHMNDDHRDDNLLIARAFGPHADLASSTMIGFDGDHGVWDAVATDGSPVAVVVPWPGGPITERAEVRREIVSLYDQACERLGVAPRPHA